MTCVAVAYVHVRTTVQVADGGVRCRRVCSARGWRRRSASVRGMADCASIMAGCASIMGDCASIMEDCASVMAGCASIMGDCASVMGDCASTMEDCQHGVIEHGGTIFDSSTLKIARAPTREFAHAAAAGGAMAGRACRMRALWTADAGGRCSAERIKGDERSGGVQWFWANGMMAKRFSVTESAVGLARADRVKAWRAE
jgi:hypothetical protein